MCTTIIGHRGQANTLQEAYDMGYLIERLVVRSEGHAVRPAHDSCYCGIDVPATLDACGNVWDFNGNDYIVHEQVTFLEAENEQR